MSGSNDHIDTATKLLKAGELVAVPTETVYGLAADASNADAVAQIYRTKGRPDFNPLIVHVPDLPAAKKLGQFNRLAETFVTAFWPGPLTLVVPKTSDCSTSPAVTAGLDTIALRSPSHPVMRTLLEQSNLFLAAPSANRSGGISPTTADHVRNSLGDAAPMILDAGACKTGLESTIVAVRGNKFAVLRPGPIAQDALERCAGRPALIHDSDGIEAPGQLASHYAPSKPVRLGAKTATDDEYHIGFGQIKGDKNLSPTSDLAEAAAHLFAYLHLADASDRPKIAIAPIPDTAIGTAINDRLKRAAHR